MGQSIAMDADVQARVMEIVNTAVQEVGGPARLIGRGEHEMLPRLLISAYALVLREERHCSFDEIAQTLNTTPGAVQAVFEAPMQAYLQRLRARQEDLPEFERHMPPEWSDQPTSERLDPEYLAGALAKFAYAMVKREHATRR